MPWKMRNGYLDLFQSLFYDNNTVENLKEIENNSYMYDMIILDGVIQIKKMRIRLLKENLIIFFKILKISKM